MMTNAVGLAQVRANRLWAREATAAADTLRSMVAGDLIVPLFEAAPFHGDAGYAELEAAVAADPDGAVHELVAEYEALIGANGSVPFLLTVTSAARSTNDGDVDGVEVAVQLQSLPSALDGGDFLRLRALDDAVAAQFKGAIPLRSVLEVASGLAAAVRAAATPGREDAALLRRYSLVVAHNEQEALAKLEHADRVPLTGDSVFVVSRTQLPGVAVSTTDGTLALRPGKISYDPENTKAILEDAQRRATASDAFAAEPAIDAVEQVIGLLQSGDDVRVVDDYRKFYEFTVLTRVLNRALDLQRRPLPADAPIAAAEDEAHSEDVTTALANLDGLTVEAVLEQLPQGFSIQRSVLAAAVTALRAGKHLLLGGPPGTGKTTLAEAISRAVVASNYQVATATADWTTFDTIGGYLPDGGQGLKFTPGVVLRSLRTAGWLIIDEVNRADIDKAFGPLFTVLSGGDGSAGRTSVLPYATEDGPVTIKWASDVDASSSAYTITPSWRLIGTLNVADKASLFRLSFAFLRRFAVIDVPLPDKDVYRSLFEGWLASAGIDDADDLLDGAMAAIDGPVPIGPAIGRDLAEFVAQGVAPTASMAPAFESAADALATAIRLFVVPQYEGQSSAEGEKLVGQVESAAPSIPASTLSELRAALEQVALT